MKLMAGWSNRASHNLKGVQDVEGYESNRLAELEPSHSQSVALADYKNTKVIKK